MPLFDAGDPRDVEAFDALRREATEEDGQPPFSDQALVELASGRRTGLIESLPHAAGSRSPGEAGLDALVGDAAGLDAIAVATEGEEPREAELVVRPAVRRRGLGTRLVDRLIGSSRGELLVWAHGDHPAARILADRYSFAAIRELLQLRLVVPPAREDGTPPIASDGSARATARSEKTSPGSGVPPTIDAFRPGVDEEAWLALNAAAFADHPEQGRMTRLDLDARMAEAWFDPDDFLIARSSDGGMVGFCWLKVERGETPTA